MRKLFSWPSTQHHKRPLGLFCHMWTHQNLDRAPLQVLSATLSYGIPSPGHRLKRAAPSRWTAPYNPSVQQSECTPFVIQPFNFFQMFPNKQRNKIKRELSFFTAKPNGPKLSQPVKQCQSWLWEGEAGVGGGVAGGGRSWHVGILSIEIQPVCMSVLASSLVSNARSVCSLIIKDRCIISGDDNPN